MKNGLRVFTAFCLLLSCVAATAQTGGSLWAMGDNSSGQLGDGTTTTRSSPVSILSDRVQSVDVGGNHSLIVKTDGSLWAMGRNDEGELGDGTRTNRMSAVQILVGGVQSVAAGSNHSLVVKTDGSLWAMGDNSYGQLGDETRTTRTSPIQTMSSGVSFVAAGGGHSLIVKTDGSLWAMGDNASGQLGDGSTTNRTRPVQILAGGVRATATSSHHSLVVKIDGSLWAMGNNDSGELGDGTQTDRSSPVLIISSGVQSVAAGAGHSLILKTDGSLWAMGNNSLGQLGDGTQTHRAVPVAVIPRGVRSVASGYYHNLILKTDGSLWTTGTNLSGQVGGAGGHVLVPVLIARNAQGIAAGGMSSLIVASGELVPVLPSAPVITTEPANVSGAIGATASFTVVATGNPAPTYQWLLNGQIVPGQTAATFAPFGIDGYHNGWTFACVVSNAVGSVTSRAATLTVGSAASAPVITTQPANVSGAIGTTASFTVVATGNPAPTYQWLLNGQIVPGQTAATFAPFGIDGYHNGWTFACVVSNAGGSVTSRAATLTVGSAASAPVITTQPANVSGAIGTTASFTVVATGNPAPTYQWLLNGKAVAGQTAATFAPFGIDGYHNGWTFACVVSNAGGSVTSRAATLTVGSAASAPVITTQPANVSGAIGTTASFTVVATGNPAPTYQWLLNGKAVAGQTAATFAPFGIDGYHNGWTFACVVSNSAGSVTSRAATLTVGSAASAPVITTQPANVSGAIGTTASFTVVATGSPAPTYQWLLNGKAVPGQTAATFAPFGIDGYHNGWTFACVVSNAAGSVTSRAATLTVGTAASAPVITTQPANVSGAIGTTASFTVVATGSPAPTYQWLLNGKAVPGQTAATFAPFGIDGYHNGWTFACVVSNAAGSVTSRAATLTVGTAASAPTIAVQPADLRADIGADATFSLAATGSPAPTYQWLRNGQPVAGQTGSSYVPFKVEANQNGWTFACVVSNAAGSVTSHAATLTVGPASAPAGFVRIPAGTFTMGDSVDREFSSLPLHSVTLPAFYLSETVTTWAEWQRVRAWAVANRYTDLANVGAGKASDHPVHTVSWYDVVKWCNAKSEMEGLTPCYYTNTAQTPGSIYRTGEVDVANMQVNWMANGYRLPTEAEWEYAARGGLSGKRFPLGDTISQTQVNYNSVPFLYDYDLSSKSSTSSYHPSYNDGIEPYTNPVTALSKNGYGLYGMAGNSFQWCWDYWNYYDSAAQREPHGPSGSLIRVIRGGSWRDTALWSRVAYRHQDYPEIRANNVGFRCARRVAP